MSMKHAQARISICLLFSIILFTAFTNAADSKKAPAKTKLKTKKINTCEVAQTELQQLKSEYAAKGEWKLNDSWDVETDTKGDLDGDGKEDKAFVLTRTYEPVSDVLEDLKPISPENEFADLRKVAFLLIELSTLGKKQLLVSKGPAFETATRTYIVDKGLSVSKNVLVVKESTMMSMGGWTATATTWKWRKEGSDFRLIGLTTSSTHRGTGETTETDTNLLTGTRVETHDPGENQLEEETPADLKEKPKRERKAIKGKPEKKFLLEVSNCVSEDATLFTFEK